jgi:hypothetical protein
VEVLSFIIVFFISLYVMPNLINGDGDLGRRITIGNALLAKGSILYQDEFSHTMLGEDIILHEWLSDLLFAILHRLFGINGIAWLTATTIALTNALLIIGLKWLDVRTYVRLLAGFLAAAVSALHWHTRPHILTTLIFTYFVLSLLYYQKTSHLRVLIPLPFVMILWSNSHGAFISGLVTVVIFCIGLVLEKSYEKARNIAVLLCLLFLAAMINPYGPRLIFHSFDYLQLDYLVDNTQEYTSPNFHNIITWPFAGLILSMMFLGWRKSSTLGWAPLLLVLFWTASGLYSARNIPLFGQMVVPVFAIEADSLIAQISPGLEKIINQTDHVGRRAWGWMWVFLFAGFLIFSQANGIHFDYQGLGNRFDPEIFPVDALEYFQETGLPDGNMFNDFVWGGYLLYELWPGKLVFIDGQTDFYGEDLTITYDKTITGQEDWQKTFDEFDVHWIILPTDSLLAPWLDQSQDWEITYRDHVTSVWILK